MFVNHVYESLIDPRLYKLIIVDSRFRELWPLAVLLMFLERTCISIVLCSHPADIFKAETVGNRHVSIWDA